MYSLLKGLCREREIQKILVYYRSGWVGGSRFHSDFFVENHPKIALNKYGY